MLAKRWRKLSLIVVPTIGAALALTFMLLALRQNIDLYYTPRQVIHAHPGVTEHVRLGGLVKTGSLYHRPHSHSINFQVEDGQASIEVMYTGILPSLFQEGKGMIAEGYFTATGVFVADRVLAKHDENYHPPHLSKKSDK